MDQNKTQAQPSYEELLEFYHRHNDHLTEWAVCTARCAAAEKEREANLSKTLTGRLVLLARHLESISPIDFWAGITILAVNIWFLAYAIFVS